MSDEKNPPLRFLGTYFDRDVVLKMAHWAKVLAWVGTGFYLLAWAASFSQFLIQLSTGLFTIKGMTFLDILNYFAPFFTQPLPAVLYFFALQGIASVLQILLDVEDNSRRVARK
jgi:hypothetical protein